MENTGTTMMKATWRVANLADVHKVLRMLLEGKGAPEIVKEVGISIRVVRNIARATSQYTYLTDDPDWQLWKRTGKEDQLLKPRKVSPEKMHDIVRALGDIDKSIITVAGDQGVSPATVYNVLKASIPYFSHLKNEEAWKIMAARRAAAGNPRWGHKSLGTVTAQAPKAPQLVPRDGNAANVWLGTVLAKGPLSVARVYAISVADGIEWATVVKAAYALNIKRVTGPHATIWSLREIKPAQAQAIAASERPHIILVGEGEEEEEGEPLEKQPYAQARLALAAQEALPTTESLAGRPATPPPPQPQPTPVVNPVMLTIARQAIDAVGLEALGLREIGNEVNPHLVGILHDLEAAVELIRQVAVELSNVLRR